MKPKKPSRIGITGSTEDTCSERDQAKKGRKTMSKPDPIMTIEEVAEYLGLHPLTVRRLARDGEIPAFKVGRQWRVKRELFDRWMTDKSMQNVSISSK